MIGLELVSGESKMTKNEDGQEILVVEVSTRVAGLPARAMKVVVVMAARPTATWSRGAIRRELPAFSPSQMRNLMRLLLAEGVVVDKGVGFWQLAPGVVE